MRSISKIAAIVFGFVGVLVCAAALGIGWWAAMRATARVDRISGQLDHGLSAVDSKLNSIESRLNTVRTNLNAVRGAAETIVAENPELPRVQAEIERLLDRLVQAFDRADGLADSLGSVAVGLRTVADIVDQFDDDSEVTVRTRNAADMIDRAAESLNGLRARVDALKSARAVELTREIVTLAREAIAGSERLAEGIAAARQCIDLTRGRMATLRDEVAYWITLAAIATTLIALWSGLGQLCMIRWGRQPLHLPRGDRAAEGS